MVRKGCGQSGQETLKLTLSEEWTEGVNWFFYVYTNSQKVKVDREFFKWALSKMGVVSLVTVLENWLYRKNEQMELTDFLQASTNSRKSKVDWSFLVGDGQKWVWPVWSLDSKIDHIWRMTRWKLIFFHVENFFGWAWSKMGVACLVTGLENWLYLKNEQMK